MLVNAGTTMDKRRRILFFTGSLGKGGAEMHLLRLANHLDSERYAVTIAVLEGGGDYEPMLKDSVDIAVLDVGPGPTLLRYLKAMRPLRKLVEALQPDLVCPVMDLPAIAALRSLRQLTVPIVPLVQCVPSYAYGKQGGFSGRLIYQGMRRLYPEAARVIALTHGVAADVRAIVGPSAPTIDVIHNAGVDETVRASARRAQREKPERPLGPLMVACGRLMPVKGYSDLLTAMAQLVREEPEAKLWIVGEGPEREALEALIEELDLEGAVELKGFQSDPFAYMAAADVFVLSSLHEGFGNVIVEAMACDTPVVSTDCPHGPGEIINHGNTGLLVPPAEPEKMADALLRLIRDGSLQGALSLAGRERSEDFSAESIARQYERVFDLTTESSPR